MSIKGFLKWYVVVCIGLLCIPLLGTTKAVTGTELLENQLVEHALVAIQENHSDWNTWSSIDNTANVISEDHVVMLASGTVESHAKANPESAKREAEGAITSTTVTDFLELAKYGKSIHVMAMLMVGFGFLMVFVKRYGYSAVTATYIAVSIVLPYYMFLKTLGIFGEPAELKMDRLILAEFCAASILIAMGAFLGRLKDVSIHYFGDDVCPILYA